jgi:hypothetical protein
LQPNESGDLPSLAADTVRLGGVLKVQVPDTRAKDAMPITLIYTKGSAPVAGEFDQIDVKNSPYETQIDYAGGDGNDVVLRFVMENPPPNHSAGCSYLAPRATSAGFGFTGLFGALLGLLGLASLTHRKRKG